MQSNSVTHIAKILDQFDESSEIHTSLSTILAHATEAKFGIQNYNFIYNGIAKDLQGIKRDRPDNTLNFPKIGIGASEITSQTFPANDTPSPFKATQRITFTKETRTEEANIDLDFGNVTRPQTQAIAKQLELIVNHEDDNTETISSRLQENNLFNKKDADTAAQKIIQYPEDVLSKVETLRQKFYPPS